MKPLLVRMLLFSVLLLVLAVPAHAADRHSIKAKIRQVQQERLHLKSVRNRLESRLGDLGRQLHGLDAALATARQAAEKAEAAVRQADDKLTDLAHQQHSLKKRIARLKRRMAQEAAAAYERGGRQPGLADLLQGVSMAELPHRRYMAARLIAAQEADRRLFHDSVAKLQTVVEATRRERTRLSQLQQEKEQKRQQLAAQRRAKQRLWHKVRHSARLQKERDRQLAAQEAALRKLLKGLGSSTLLATDQAADWMPVRRLKGKLPWPLKGRIVGHFGHRPAHGRPRLAGVLLAPTHGGGQVKAIAAGQVRYADWFGGYGLMMIVDHGQGLMSVYAHNDVLYKHLGDWVEPGDVLAQAGSTGWVEHVRLYFEMRDRGKPTNPVRWCHR